MPAKPIYADAQVVTTLTNTGGAVWHTSVITYNFPNSVAPYAYESAGFSHATAAQQSMTDYWMRAWDDVVGASIVRVADTVSANVTVANSYAPGYAYSYYPNSYPGAGVYLNPSFGSASGTNNLVTPTLGNWGAMAIGHELGHALGLSHPGAYNGGSPTYEANAAYMQDSLQYTIMSYFTADKTGCDWVASDGKVHYAQTPMMNDIMALQSLYGVDGSTRATATTYGFHSGLAGSVYDFSTNPHPVLCIYDAGGKDTLDLSGYASASRISLVAGSFSDCDAMTGNISIARNVTIENAVGGSGNDVLVGNAVDNVLSGGAGADAMSGGLGNDTYVVDNALDKVTEQANQGIDGVVSSLSWVLGANVENLTLTGTAAINGTGNALNNVLTGNGANNVLDGAGGADSMSGGPGNDSYVVDAAADTVTELAGQGSDSVSASVTYTLGANLENLTLTGTAAINGTGNTLDNALAGNAGNNLIGGLAGNDTLGGGAGADTLVGGAGSDVLTGGAGADIFRFESALGASANLDRVTDFSAADDTIQLDHGTFAKLGIVGALNAGFFHAGTTVAATDGNDYILYNSSTGGLYYDADGTGAIAPVQFATLAGAPAITAADFMVI